MKPNVEIHSRVKQKYVTHGVKRISRYTVTLYNTETFHSGKFPEERWMPGVKRISQDAL